MKKSNLLSLIIMLFSLNAVAEVKVLVSEDFESGILPNGNGWTFGAQAGGSVSISKNSAENHGGSLGSVKGTYPKGTGGMYVWGGYDVQKLKIYEVYVEFDAKMPGVTKQGVKFLKIFGGANTTFGADYTGIASGKGSIYQVSFGDGRTTQNDTQNVINFNGEYPNWIGRSYGSAKVRTPQLSDFPSKKWGDGWHHFRFRIKFNTGDTPENEVADGAYYVEIDGKTYVDAEGLFNRHYSNKPIVKIGLFDWSQNNTDPFELWYDNIVITTGGFLPSKRPSAPATTN